MMINLPLDISLPEIWGDAHFVKNDWGAINVIVGPNGTGKSLLANEIKTKVHNQGIITRLLSAERLAGLEKQEYSYFSNGNFSRGFDISHFQQLRSHGDNYGLSSSAFVILRDRLDIRLHIEAMLSDIFGKT